MLVLSRNKDESIMVGEDVEIAILRVNGNKVLLGITAPVAVPVHRKEVFEAIRDEGLEGHYKRSNQRRKFARRLSHQFNNKIISGNRFPKQKRASG